MIIFPFIAGLLAIIIVIELVAITVDLFTPVPYYDDIEFVSLRKSLGIVL